MKKYLRNQWHQQALFFLLIAFSIGSCKKDKPEEKVVQPTPVVGAKREFIVNEGNFGSGNSSLSLYNSESGQMIEDYYVQQNSSPMGDVAQSINKIKGKYYLVINNSAKILVCDSLMKKQVEITGFTSPRYMVQASPNKAYVSDIAAGEIHIIDLTANTKIGKIALPGWAEQMVFYKDKMYITNLNSSYMFVINTQTDKIEDSVFVGPGSGSCVLDKNGFIWVVGSGDQTLSIPARLSKISSDDLSTTFSTLSGFNYPGYLCASKSSDTLYFINKDVYRLNANQSSISPELFLARGTRSFYGMAVNHRTHNIYISDAIDYTQKSNIYIYSTGGVERKVIKAGINSNSFYFE